MRCWARSHGCRRKKINQSFILRKQKLHKPRAGELYNNLASSIPWKAGSIWVNKAATIWLNTCSASSSSPKHLYVAPELLLSPPKYHTLSFGLVYKILLLLGMLFAWFVSDAESCLWEHCEYVCLLAQGLAQCHIKYLLPNCGLISGCFPCHDYLLYRSLGKNLPYSTGSFCSLIQGRLEKISVSWSFHDSAFILQETNSTWLQMIPSLFGTVVS